MTHRLIFDNLYILLETKKFCLFCYHDFHIICNLVIIDPVDYKQILETLEEHETLF